MTLLDTLDPSPTANVTRSFDTLFAGVLGATKPSEMEAEE